MSGWGRIFDNAHIGLQDRAMEMARLQEQAASGKRVLRASDDPGAAYRILGLHEEVQGTEAYIENLRTVMMRLENSASILQQVTTNLIRAKELLTQAASGTYNEDNRHTIAMEIDGILENTLVAANIRVQDTYLFGGALTSTAPFAAERENGRICDVTYEGSHDERLVPVAPGVRYYGTMIGDSVFQVSDREAPVFYGNTGAAAGSGTSSVRGSQWLTLTHTTTQYAAGVGIAAGATSSDGDTILGGAHTLTVDADLHTVRLDGGQAVAYSALTTDLKLTNEHGDAVYVDTSGVTLAAGQQTVAIDAHGEASLDAGLTTVNVTTFGDNLAVPDGDTGRILYVDASNLTRVGTEAVCVAGTYDMFGMLINIRDLLLDEYPLTTEGRSELLANAMDSLEEVMDGVMRNLTAVGSRLQSLDMLQAGLETVADNAKAESAAIGDADIAEISIGLAKTQTLYEMTLMSIANMLSLSLMDFLTG